MPIPYLRKAYGTVILVDAVKELLLTNTDILIQSRNNDRSFRGKVLSLKSA